MSDSDLLRENQIEHQEEYARPEKIYRGSLNEAQAAKVAHLFQFQFQNFPCGGIQPVGFLLGKAKAFHKLNVTERFRCGSRQGGCFLDNRLLNDLDLLAQHRAEENKQGNGEKVHRCNQPVDADRIDHDKHHPHQRCKHDIDGCGHQSLNIRAHLLKFTECFPAPLVLEYLVGQIQ